MTKHGGDFKAAANNLRNLGYGAQTLNSFDSSNNLMPAGTLLEPLVTPSEDESSWKSNGNWQSIKRNEDLESLRSQLEPIGLRMVLLEESMRHHQPSFHHPCHRTTDGNITRW
jgi:hypothetical protein